MVIGLVSCVVIGVIIGIVRRYEFSPGSYRFDSVSRETNVNDSAQLMEFVGWEYRTSSGDTYLFDRDFTLRIISTTPFFDTQTGWTYGLIKAQVRGIGTHRLVSDLHSIENTATISFSSTQLLYLTDQADRFVSERTDYFFHHLAGILVYVPLRVAMHEIQTQSFSQHNCYGSWEATAYGQQVFTMTLCDQPRRVSQRAKTDHSILIGDMIMYIRATDTFYPVNQITLFSEQEFLSFIPPEEEKNGVDSE
ncbi:MAG: hypothetical protein NZL83_02245 [Candidatus Absconditabacterales bacterium]|nr:hypothetical protein [Candidatus Absconditabacterales bacterium]